MEVRGGINDQGWKTNSSGEERPRAELDFRQGKPNKMEWHVHRDTQKGLQDGRRYDLRYFERSAAVATVRNKNVRSYVDKDVTIWLYAQRKLRGAGHKDDLEIAIPGIKAAIDLSVNQADSEEAGHLVELQAEFSRQLACSNTAYATKRHGRDRAHSILDECHSFLESALGRSVTDRTLANLVNAGYEADGNLLTEPVTEEHIRKNLATFRKNNPNWRNNINSLVH